MIKQSIKTTKYEELINEFFAIKSTNPKYTLVEFTKERNLVYRNIQQACARRGVYIEKKKIQGKQLKKCYSVLQFGVDKKLFDKLNKESKKQKITKSKLIAKLLKQALV